MQLLVFTVLGAVAFLISYAFGLDGTDGSLIFLAFLMTGGFLRVAQPLLDRLKP